MGVRAGEAGGFLPTGVSLRRSAGAVHCTNLMMVPAITQAMPGSSFAQRRHWICSEKWGDFSYAHTILHIFFLLTRLFRVRESGAGDQQTFPILRFGHGAAPAIDARADQILLAISDS